MAKHKGSTKPLEPMKTRDPAAFQLISNEISRLGPEEVARYGNISTPTVYTFLAGNKGVSELMESMIFTGVTKKKAADSQRDLKLRNQALQAIIS